jgi:hypothetical protein
MAQINVERDVPDVLTTIDDGEQKTGRWSMAEPQVGAKLSDGLGKVRTA